MMGVFGAISSSTESFLLDLSKMISLIGLRVHMLRKGR
jgi:hypothetical protein